MSGLTLFPAIRVPHEELLRQFLSPTLLCYGGFPLYCYGGADTYNDIDLYATDWQTFYEFHKDWKQFQVGNSKEALYYEFAGDKWQLTRPVPQQGSMLALMRSSDMSASAVALTRRDDEWKCWVMYPEDIEKRICRVLIEHEWTLYRTDIYEQKGFTVL